MAATIQSMAPELFLVQVLDSQGTARDFTTEEFDAYQERFDSTWVGASENATADQFGITPAAVVESALVSIKRASGKA